MSLKKKTNSKGKKKASNKLLNSKSSQSKSIQQHDQLNTLIQQSQLHAGSLSPNEMLQLQQAVGNKTTGKLITKVAQDQPVQSNSGLNQTSVIQRTRNHARSYNQSYGLGINFVAPSAATVRGRVMGYINNVANPVLHRLGLRVAWNRNQAAANVINLPEDLARADAVNDARLGLYNRWGGGSPTEQAIAGRFNPGGGAAAPAAANLVAIATQNNRAAIGHDGGHFGSTLQPHIAGAGDPPPLYLSAWLWNRGLVWTRELNNEFIDAIIGDVTITDVDLVSPTFTPILQAVGTTAAHGNAQNNAIRDSVHGGQVSREIRRLLAGGFYWNGATLHR